MARARYCIALATLGLMISLLGCALIAYAADQPLVSWDFSKDADVGKWFPAHSLAPFDAADGALKTRATEGDPYMIVKDARAFDIDANDFQYIEIKLKSDKEGGAEFFWANTTEGRDQGFVGGKERAFAVKGDGQFHVYRVFPGWEGHVSRLRFDPPDDAAIEVGFIRVMQAPVTTHDPLSPRWDFKADGAGGFIPTSGCTYDAGPDGLKTTLDSENAILTGPVVNLQASDYACATLHFTASAPMQLMLNWSDTTDGNFPGSNVIPFDIAKGEDYMTLNFAEMPAWSGAVKRIAIGLVGKPEDTITLHSLAFGKQPEGPAKLTVVSFAGEKSIYAVGEPIKLTLRIRNDGGAAAHNVKANVTVDGTNVTADSPGPTEVADVASGAAAEVAWTMKAGKAGMAPVSLKIEGEGLFKPAEAATQLIVTEPVPELAAAGGKPVAIVKGAGAVVGNDRVRLTFAKDARGFENARIDIMEGNQQRTMGYLPYLARVAAGDDTEALPVAMTSASASSDATAASLTMKGTRSGVTVEAIYTAKAGKPWIDVSYRVSAGKAIALKAFHGPWIWAGEGSFADEQDHALFPGVEWLVKGERSSSSLDISPPMNVRFAPHPNWVTVPSMAVEKDRAIVGLMWDPLQKWDGVKTRPSAVFASPNFVEARRNHLMGLFLPSIPDYVDRNKLLAKKPYELQPGKALTLQASIFAQPRTDVTQAVTNWYDRFCGGAQVPSLPLKPRDYAATVDMSMRAYEKVLWKPEAGGWMPVVGWTPGKDMGAANLYYTSSFVHKANPAAAAWREKALSVAQGSTDLTYALRVSGMASGALNNILAAGQSGALSQPEGARYAFHPEGSRKVLGPDGGIAVGIAAGAVIPILDAAIRTGDKAALEAGLKGLAFMDQFDVPRASQVWECPLHSPDILASGQACRAYLLGYRLTGDRKYLRSAIFWARTGLPFTYAWRAPEMPQLMKYATIPIFGATFYTGSWFGVPVQWNGLDYATACLELAPYDKSFPWRQIGEGITISGMNMQSTRAKDYGCYTDNWNVVTNTECVGCMLSPGAILSNVFRMTGTPGAAGVDGVVTPSGWIAVNGPGDVTGAALKGDTLTAQAGYLAGQSGCLAVMPVTKPAAVSADGKPLAFSDKGDPQPGQWSYDAHLGCVAVKLQFGAKPATVSMTGVQHRELAVNQSEWIFDAAGDPQGWSAEHDLSQPVVADGAVKMSITGGDPYFVSPLFGVPAEKVTGIAIRVRASKPGGQFFWANNNGSFAPARSVNISFPADGQFHDVVVDLTAHPEWTGVIRQVRVDFNGGVGDTAELQWVKVVRK